MNTTEEAKEDLHAEAQSLLKQHVALMRKINTLTIERILIENRLADIDEALKGAQ